MDTGLVLVDGAAFFASDRVGDASTEQDGLFFADTRHLSVWRLTIGGAPVRLLTCDTPQYYSARIHATLPTTRVDSTRPLWCGGTGSWPPGCMRTSSWTTTAARVASWWWS